MDKNTRKMLGLTDPNLIFDENWLEEEEIKKRKAQVIIGKLTFSPTCCANCGRKNEGTILKNGHYQTTSQLPNMNRRTTYLRLKRARFLCTSCQTTFSAQTPLVDDYCCISKQLKYQIALDLKENVSRKHIAQHHGGSDNTVLRVLDTFTQSCKPTFHSLPSVISVDEFKSMNTCEGSMSFICVDPNKKEIIDILEDRRVYHLTQYFMKFDRAARLKVKFIVMDMNANYGALLKVVFPNAEIVTDRFHIIQHINRSFNQLRINCMNSLKRYTSEEGKQYRRLKKFWKLLLKDSNKLNYATYHYRPLFKRYMTQSEIVDELLTYHFQLRLAYDFVQDLKYAYSTKNVDMFFQTIETIPSGLPKRFRTKFNIFHTFKTGVTNAFNYTYSNGYIEGLNNKIKVIKRVAYGYRNFQIFKKRIFLIQGKSFIVA